MLWNGQTPTTVHIRPEGTLDHVSANGVRHRSAASGQNTVLIDTAKKLKESDRRVFIARIVRELGRGGQRWVEKYLGWNRGNIHKGMHELESGIRCVDAFSFRGRKKIEQRLPSLLNDIKDILDPNDKSYNLRRRAFWGCHGQRRLQSLPIAA